MSEYSYINDYEREQTQKYEGVYSPNEIELNKKLREACSQNVIDILLVEELLKQGADPLGGTALCGWDLLEHIYGDEVVCNSQDSDSLDLPQITKIFLEYGMDVDKPRIPYDGENSLNPLWHFAHIASENAIGALKMLLDHGLSMDSFSEFWDHSMIDFFHLGCGDPQYDEFWNTACTWTFKMLLLGASYDHILENDEELRKFICYSYNTYDIHKFRNWDNFEYFFDTSHCEKHPELYGSIIHIYEKSTDVEVWKIGVGVAGRKVLYNIPD